MKYGIYFAYWEKEWETDYLPYLERVKRLGFDILEISCAALQNASHESLQMALSSLPAMVRDPTRIWQALIRPSLNTLFPSIQIF